VSISGRQERIQLFPEISINRELGTTNMAVLDRRQVRLMTRDGHRWEKGGDW